ncbi:MAG: hypothetical protein LBC37_06940 [Zoogloeaceae bacterium]|jgi:hypothetical protein|nr:hypothetical protein [Zoogloeaceae bacterium]
MRLDRLELELRRRTPWEALDLGMGMVRRWALPVYRVWFLFLLLPALLILLLFSENVWVWLGVWWLKPVADRLLLKVFAEASFGAPPTIKQVWQSLPELLRRSGLFASLTWRRLSFYRSFTLPILQLEGQRGEAFRKRGRILGRKTQGYATWLMLVCVHCIVIFEVGLLLLAFWLTPGDFLQESLFARGVDGAMNRFESIFYVLLWLSAETLVEPFYVAAGFSLYLNRRSDLEGWDIEVAFRRMQDERTQATPARLGKGAASVVPAMLLALLFGFAAQPFSSARAEDAENRAPPEEAVQAEAVVRVEGEARRQALSVLAGPDFGRVEEKTRWRWRNQSGADRNAQKQNAQEQDWDLDGSGLIEFFGGLAKFVRILLYGLIVLALAVCVVFFYRNRALFRQKAQPQKSARPQTLFGLDLRPDALPDDIPTTALAEAEAGHWVAALSLLYRGALVTLIERDRVIFRAGDTEDLCLLRVRGHVQDEALTVFAALLRDWKAAAYAGSLPTLARIRALCADWRAHFAVSPAAGEEGA